MKREMQIIKFLKSCDENTTYQNLCVKGEEVSWEKYYSVKNKNKRMKINETLLRVFAWLKVFNMISHNDQAPNLLNTQALEYLGLEEPNPIRK